LYIVIAAIIGFILAWLLANYRFLSAGTHISSKELGEKYILKDLANDLNQRHQVLKEDHGKSNQVIVELNKDLAGLEQINVNLAEKLENQKGELELMSDRFKSEFENLSSKLLEEKSQQFALQNQTQIGNLLSPLKEKIQTFEESIERKFLDETKERASLKTELAMLKDLNQQLSQDANNLALALKGNSKTQGDWGEFRLEMLLEKAGLTRDIHYLVQSKHVDEEGMAKRPDFIIRLPDNKHLVIDSKVSLTAYEQFFSSSEPEHQKQQLKLHVDSIRRHIKDLSSKNYQHLYSINSPDYLMLFVPIEPALHLALQEDHRLFTDAFERNIVLVSTSTLLATLRTVSFIWTQEKQKNNVLEIARQSGLLYDKFVGFVEDLKGIGASIEKSQSNYLDAMNKLTDAKRSGDTLIGRAEKIRELGAKTSKLLPRDLLELNEE
jgi:DNA recombination protein RmuC